MDLKKHQARLSLERRLTVYRPTVTQPRPLAGWIRATRDALGMSGADLARRMGVTQPAIRQLEKSEQAGTIQLATLRRAAAALDCTVVYALVPNCSLEDIVRARARDVAERELAATDHTMRLEGQTPPADLREDLVDILADQIVDSRRLWSEP